MFNAADLQSNQKVEISAEELYPAGFFVKDNCLYKDGKLLCNFLAYAVLQVTIDDGVKTTNNLVVSGIAHNGKRLPAAEITNDEFSKMSWVTEKWGYECNITPGSSARENVRYAIQSTAENISKKVVYSVTGWKKINGDYIYLMPGDQDNTVELENKMSGYYMERNYSIEDIKKTADFLINPPASIEIMLPLLSFVFLTPLNCFLREAGCEPKNVIMLLGKTGSKKSTLAALMLSFFGNFAATTLPMSFKDTANSILHNSFSLKDVLTCIDDYHPSKKCDEVNMTVTMQTIIRAFGDRTGRGRLTAQSELMETRFPQGNAIVTAEFPPDIGESGAARYLTVEMSPDCMDNKLLSEYQKMAVDRVFNRCLFAYTEWIREKYLKDEKSKHIFISELKELFQRERNHAANELNANGISYHPRIPEDYAVLSIGLKYYIDFLTDKHIYTEEAKIQLPFYNETLVKVVMKQTKNVEQDRPVFKFICKLYSLLESGRCTVISKDSKDDVISTSFIGYEDEQSYYLNKSLVHQAVKKLCNEQAESFTITERALADQLKSEQLVVTDSDGNVTQPVRLGNGKLKRLLVIPKEKMMSIVDKYL